MDAEGTYRPQPRQDLTGHVPSGLRPSYFRGPTTHLLGNEPRESWARTTRAPRATGWVPGIRAARAPSKPSTLHNQTGLGACQPQPRGCPWPELGGLRLVNRQSPHGPLYRTCFHHQRTKGMTACSSGDITGGNTFSKVLIKSLSIQRLQIYNWSHSIFIKLK